MNKNAIEIKNYVLCSTVAGDHLNFIWTGQSFRLTKCGGPMHHRAVQVNKWECPQKFICLLRISVLAPI